MKRFWNWLTPQASSPNSDGGERVLRINGVIAGESWLDDEITPAVFASELIAGSGPVTIWLNSPGGDVVAAARIYNMLLDYPGKVTVNIDGIAASAASVIAMAASTVAMSPVSMLMTIIPPRSLWAIKPSCRVPSTCSNRSRTRLSTPTS